MLPITKAVSADDVGRLLSLHRLTQQDLATSLGMSRANVTNWKSGKWKPRYAAYHIAVRHFLECGNTVTISAKIKPGRSLNDHGFALVGKAKCPYPACQRGDRQMRAEREPYDHTLLDKILPVFCDGTHAHKHDRMTRAIDRKGRLWDISAWPRRKKLAPFELQRVKRALAEMGEQPDPTALLRTLQYCAPSLDGKPGCNAPLRYDGRLSTSNAMRRRLHVFYCSKENCSQQWERRLFDSGGNEVRRNPVGQSMLGHRTIRLPYKAMICPVCAAPLRFPKEVSEIGGVRYSPPLLRLWCENRDVDHSPRERRERGLPSGSRSGLTFYYDRKKSHFVEIYLKALKKGHPVVKCSVHGRMRVSTIRESSIARVPKGILERLGSTFPVSRARCRFGCREVWISADGKKMIRRSPRPRSRAKM